MLATQVSASPPSISAKQFFIINRSLVTAVSIHHIQQQNVNLIKNIIRYN